MALTICTMARRMVSNFIRENALISACPSGLPMTFAIDSVETSSHLRACR